MRNGSTVPHSTIKQRRRQQQQQQKDRHTHCQPNKTENKTENVAEGLTAKPPGVCIHSIDPQLHQHQEQQQPPLVTFEAATMPELDVGTLVVGLHLPQSQRESCQQRRNPGNDTERNAVGVFGFMLLLTRRHRLPVDRLSSVFFGCLPPRQIFFAAPDCSHTHSSSQKIDEGKEFRGHFMAVCFIHRFS